MGIEIERMAKEVGRQNLRQTIFAMKLFNLFKGALLPESEGNTNDHRKDR